MKEEFYRIINEIIRFFLFYKQLTAEDKLKLHTTINWDIMDWKHGNSLK